MARRMDEISFIISNHKNGEHSSVTNIVQTFKVCAVCRIFLQILKLWNSAFVDQDSLDAHSAYSEMKMVLYVQTSRQMRKPKTAKRSDFLMAGTTSGSSVVERESAF